MNDVSCIVVFFFFFFFFLSFRNLIQYRIKMGTEQRTKEDDFGIIVMGSTKVGKTTFVKHMLRINDNTTNATKRIDNLFEYREHTESSDRSQQPALRSRAVEMGSLFVLIFSVNDLETFNFASDLRASIVAKKGEDVPVIVVGLKQEHTRSISYEFADLVVSCDLESKYFELSFSNDKEISAIHSEILNQQQSNYRLTKSRGQNNGVGQTLKRLLSTENMVPGLLHFFKTFSNK